MMRAVIAAVVVLVIVAGIFLLQNKNSPVEVKNTAVNPTNPEINGEIVRPETHVIECGKPDYLEDKWKDKSGNEIVVLEVGQSHEGATIDFLHSPKWINKCGLDDIKEKKAALAGLAIYSFDVKRDDNFYVFLRAKWTDTCGNSCWILVDGPEKGGHGPEAGQYYMIEDQEGMKSEKDYETAWHPLKVSGKMKEFHLAPGKHRIEIHTREDGPRFDQLVISTNANVPVGVAQKRD